MDLQTNDTGLWSTIDYLEVVREVHILIHLRHFISNAISVLRFTLPLRGYFVPCSWIGVGRRVVRGLSGSESPSLPSALSLLAIPLSPFHAFLLSHRDISVHVLLQCIRHLLISDAVSLCDTCFETFDFFLNEQETLG